MAERMGRIGGKGGGGGNKKKKRKTAAKGARAAAPEQPGASALAALILAPLRVLLQSLSKLMQQVRVLHKDSPCKSCDASSPSPPVAAYQNAARILAEQCAKLASLFSSGPSSVSTVECATEVCSVEQAAASLVAAYNHISPMYGLALHREAERSVLDILRGIEGVINTIIATGTIRVPRSLKNTGGTPWEFSMRANKVSRDNKAAVVKETMTQLNLLRDGCKEAMHVATMRGKGEALMGGATGEVGELCEGVKEVNLGDKGGGPREWNERERQLAEPCVDLIKVCSEVMGELCCVLVREARCGVPEGEARELDQTLFLVVELSPLVDELVGELPAPLLWPDCQEAGQRLASALFRLLHTIGEFHICSCSEKWKALSFRYLQAISSLNGRIITCGATKQPPTPHSPHTSPLPQLLPLTHQLLPATSSLPLPQALS